MNDDVDWLVTEIDQLLRVGRVGVYEFAESLRERHPDAPAASLRPTCQAALDKFLSDPTVQLGWYVWASGEQPTPASIADIRPETFDAIGSDPYLGIERV